MSDQGGSTGLARLERVYGGPFLRYALNLPPEMDLSEISSEGLNSDVLALLTHQATLGDGDPFTTYLNAMSLSQYHPPAQMSLVNVLRVMSGGQVEAPPAEGDASIESALERLAADLWPMYLLRPHGDGPRTFWMSSPMGVYQHPAFEVAIDAFLADESLRRLFPYSPEESEVAGEGWTKATGYLSLVIGSGFSGSMQLTVLLPSLVSSGVFRCLMNGTPLSYSAIVPQLHQVLEDLRSLAQGQEVKMPTLVGFAGVRLPEGQSLQLGNGTLRPTNPVDTDLFLRGGEGGLTTVLETTYPARIYEILEHNFEDDDDPFKSISKYQSRTDEARRSFNRETDHIRMARLMACPTLTEPWLLREVARYTSDPLSHGGSANWEPGYAAVPSHELSFPQFHGVKDWHSTVKAKHVPSLDIGLRRLLSAATVRTDPIDAFVDAVVVWENVFGVRTETNFRVTAAMAKLLEPSDMNAREALFTELKGLYGKRSQLVHGGPEPKPDDLMTYRQRAIEIAVHCFRTLYKSRPDLLGEPSELRGSRLLLE